VSVPVALGILTWVAVLVLYLALAAVLREVRLLRRQVARLSVQVAPGGTGAEGTPTGAAPGLRRTDLALTPAAAGRGGPVLAATSTCPLCRVALDRLARWAVASGSPATLLTYEPDSAWGELPGGVRVVRDDAAWSGIAHIDPPLLMDVADDGAVRDIALPATGADVDAALALWPASQTR